MISIPSVSLLLPIYNASDFLAQALDSAISQTLPDIEIICLNDGSTDDSLKIIQKYAAKDSRIIIIDKPNTGYGDTMNQGIKTAHGEYLAILEPDDYLEPRALAELYQLAKSADADVVKCNFFIEKSGKSEKTVNILPKDVASIHLHIYERLFSLPPAIWAALYRREFLLQNHIEFLPTPGASFQDLGFNFKTLALARHIVLTTDAFLHYRSDNSASSSNSAQKVACVVEEYASIAKFLKNHDRFSEYGRYMAAAKFRNYFWNWQRLSGSAASEFYHTMCSELTEANREALFHRSDFNLKHWLALQLILKHPRLASRLLHR